MKLLWVKWERYSKVMAKLWLIQILDISIRVNLSIRFSNTKESLSSMKREVRWPWLASTLVNNKLRLEKRLTEVQSALATQLIRLVWLSRIDHFQIYFIISHQKVKQDPRKASWRRQSHKIPPSKSQCNSRLKTLKKYTLTLKVISMIAKDCHSSNKKPTLKILMVDMIREQLSQHRKISWSID